MNRPGKRPAASAVDDNVYKIFPNDLNSERTVFGGLVMGLCDRTALIVAERHTGLTCVTAAIDSLHFISPARAGETLIVKAKINRAWNSSMEIGVKVITEDPRNGQTRHVVSAYFTFVGLDSDGRPVPVPLVLPETAEDKRRYGAAEVRRNARMSARLNPES
ncbi:MAG TPA: acyl-CoA thioesterase [Woeseiaceae bacterium]|nr:acyl-CoA thioesterase [Woeseiaceae bacterium]